MAGTRDGQELAQSLYDRQYDYLYPGHAISPLKRVIIGGVASRRALQAVTAIRGEQCRRRRDTVTPDEADALEVLAHFGGESK